jgi:hypothetical protein
MSTTMSDSTTTEGPRSLVVRTDLDIRGRNTDVLDKLTPAEFWHEYDRLAYLDDGRYHLSGIKECAGIGSRDTHVDLEQLKALHAATGRIIDGLDHPASHGPTMGIFVGFGKRSVADLAADAGVDADALQRHLDGEGPMSHIAYIRVVQAGVKAAKA